jgi:hypothetical protein
MSTIPSPITPKVRPPKSRMTPALVAGGRKRICWWMLTSVARRDARVC